MSQITIYLDAATEKQARKRAKAEGVSVSKWIAKTIQGERQDTWPTSIVAAFGDWGDVPDVKAIRSLYVKDVPRERL